MSLNNTNKQVAPKNTISRKHMTQTVKPI